MKHFPAFAVLIVLATMPLVSKASRQSFILFHSKPAPPDSLDEQDTLPVYQPDPKWDTSYFFSGDPEYNLIVAAEKGQLNVVRMLVERGVSVDAATREGVTPLMYAAQSGDLAMVDYLVSKGARLDLKPDNGISALTGAVRANQYEVVKYLIQAGAEVDVRDFTDLTALMYASAYNYAPIVTLLTEAGAELEAKDWFGTTPLMMAVYYDCYESAGELIRLGANVNAQDTFGFTPLMIAAQHGDYHMAWLLLDKGADPDMQNKGGQHALSMAVMNEHPDIIELLVESGANPNQKISSSANALNLAAEMGKDEMVSYLKALGARKNRSPEISGLRFSASLGFNGDDYFMALEGGLSEFKYRTYLTTGFGFRPSAVRILRKENDSLSFQFWERRYVWPVSLGKQFKVFTNEEGEYGIHMQITGALTWGNYRGSDRHPDLRYMLVPAAGFIFRKNWYGFTLDYAYRPLKVYDISPHFMRMGMQFYIDLRKRTRFTYKHIEWF